MSEIEKVSRVLLKKYDRPGPRYTSYPTVPEWSSDFGPDDYVAALQKASAEDNPLSLYFHIPFCRSRCRYCGCTTTIARDASIADDYIKILDKELNMVAAQLGNRTKVIQMHWGGGTPTYLDADRIKTLFGIISGYVEIDSAGELAIEVDPRDTTGNHAQVLKELGFNRISMGVQDLTPQVQKAIGRYQTLEQTENLFRLCRELGYSGINVDLIYGLPHQTVENFSNTIAEVIRMGADRVAVYSFAYLPEIRSHQKAISPDTLPSAADKFELFATAVERFTSAGYVQIGMDHFARPDDELARSLADGRLYRNFMGYTSRLASDSIGFGMSAISEIAGVFAQNISKLDDYVSAVSDQKLATFRGCRLSRDDLIRQRAILSLMCNFALKFEELDRQFGIDSRNYFSLELDGLKTFIDDELVDVNDADIRVTPRGRAFVRNIAMVFDAYLRSKGDRDRPAFSRTI